MTKEEQRMIERAEMNEKQILEEEEIENAQKMMQGASDPFLWTVKCKPGKERILTVSLMNKFLAKQQRTDKLMILSAMNSDKVPGVIYIEAFKLTHVRDAVKGLQDVFQGKIKKVPKSEAHKVFSIDKATTIDL